MMMMMMMMMMMHVALLNFTMPARDVELGFKNLGF